MMTTTAQLYFIFFVKENQNEGLLHLMASPPLPLFLVDVTGQKRIDVSSRKE
jgi:hypothetical protein